MGNHPSMEELRAFNVGLVSEAALEEHVEACAQCDELLATLPDDRFVELLRREPTTIEFDGRIDGAIPPELLNHQRYRILEKLGEGGMGVVYKAEHLLMKRVVALKVIRQRFVQDHASQQRFLREINAVAKLKSPQIVTVHDAEKIGNVCFYTMEWIDGETLAAWSKQKGPATEAECLVILRQIAEGLQHAHELGVVHRDIKPHNLMRGADGAILILDFGLARIATASDANDMTQSRATLGTPAYMAPEQMRDARRADIRADLFSVGVTILHLLLAKTPSHDELAPAVIAKRLPNLSPKLRGILNRVLMEDPGARFQTPKELLDAMQPAPTIRPAKPKGSLFVGLAIGGTLLATLVLLLAAGILAWLGVLFPGASDSNATKEPPVQGKDPKTPNDRKVAEEKPGKKFPEQGKDVKTPNDKKVAEEKRGKDAPLSPKNAVLKSLTRYGQSGFIKALGFGPGEREFCAGSFTRLNRWNVDAPDKPWPLALPRGALGYCYAVAVAPAKDRALVAIHNGAIISLDVNSKLEINPNQAEPLIPEGGRVNYLWFSPKGDRFVYSRLTNVGAVQEWPSGKQKSSFKGKACVFCKGGEELVVAVDGCVVWKAVDTEDEFFKSAVTKSPATAIAASGDGATVVTGNKDSGISPALVYRRGNPTPTPLGTEVAISAVAITPDGAYIVTGGGGALILWDGVTLEKLGEIPDAHDKKYGPSVTTIRFSPDGSLLLSGGGDGVIRSWSLVPKN